MPLPTSSASRDWPQFLAFLAECKEHPDDDAPRLILADWLEEHDDPRGELLRLQVLRERLSPLDPRRRQWEDREQQLWAEHAAHWLGPLWESQFSWSVQRGLLHLNPSSEQFARWPAWLNSDAFVWVEKLHLFGMKKPQEVVSLAEMPCLASLRILDLWRNPVGDPGAAALARSPHLTHLAVLDLAETGLRPAGIAGLAASTALPHLRELNLSGNGLGDACVLQLVASPLLPRLRRLELQANGITHVGAEALAAASPSLEGLTFLNLLENPISDWRKETLRIRFGERVHV